MSLTPTRRPRDPGELSTVPCTGDVCITEQQPGCFRNSNNETQLEHQSPKMSVFVVLAERLIFQRYKLARKAVCEPRWFPERRHFASREIMGPEKGLRGRDGKPLGIGTPEQAKTCFCWASPDIKPADMIPDLQQGDTHKILALARVLFPNLALPAPNCTRFSIWFT